MLRQKTKLVLTFSFLLILISIFRVGVAAQEGVGASTGLTVFPGPANNSLFGQDHKYTVHFRGNGEAVVAAKFVFTNSTDRDQKSFSLVSDDLNAKDFIAYQILRPSCTSPNCNYLNFDFAYPWGARYEKAEVDYDGEKLAVTLPEPVPVEKTGAVFLYYRSFGYTEKEWTGAYEYDFKTLESKESIQNVSVGINVDSDVYLKGAKSSVDFAMPEMASMRMADGMMQNSQLDQIVGSVGYGQITKTASSLAPDESFTVQGAYATSQLALYAKETLIGFTLVLGVFALLFLLAKKFTGKGKNRKEMYLALGLSLASTLVLVALTGALFVVTRSGLFPSYLWGGLIVLVYALFGLIFYLVVLLAPTIYMGIKHGAGWAMVTLFMTLFWLFLIFTGLFLFNSVTRFDTPVYPMQVTKGLSPQMLETESEVNANE